MKFQEGHDSERLFQADVDKTMRFFMRAPTGGDPSGEPGADAFGGDVDPQHMKTLALQKALPAYDPARDRRQFLSDDELRVYVSAFERSGFTGGVDWYRNMTGNWERAASLEQRVDAPSLMITAELDLALPPRLAEAMPAHVADLELHELKGVGHWSQQERPDEVSRLLLDWLDRRFPN